MSSNPLGNPENLRQGNPGNKGGGRPANAIRAKCAKGFDERIASLTEIAQNKPGEDGKRPYMVRDQLSAIEMLGKYGIGTKHEIEEDPNGQRLIVTFE